MGTLLMWRVLVSVSEEREQAKKEAAMGDVGTDLAVVVNAWYSAGFYTGRQDSSFSAYISSERER